jgi:predicted nucleic acid-binding protein
MIVVSNSSPLIAMAAIGRLDLLKRLYGRLLVPEAVNREVTVTGNGQPGAEEVRISNWVISQMVTDRVLVNSLQIGLDEGEAEAITLALETQAQLLLIDERRGRRVATRLGINVVGTLGILVEAKQKTLIPVLEPVLADLLKKAGFRISQQLYERILHVVGETSL